MARGFTITETINRPAAEVWSYLTDFSHATDWMDGIDDIIQLTPGKIGVGTGFNFYTRGRMYQTEITTYDPDSHTIALTSKQGNVEATYTYALTEKEHAVAEISMHITCQASGLMAFLQPLLLWIMKRTDSSQLANLKAALAAHG